MRTLFTRLSLSVVIATLVLASGLYVGCSSEKSEDVQATTEKTTENQTTAGRTVEAAETIKASIANPDPNVCPVCGMKVDYTMLTTVDSKSYALCSDNCIELFEAEPAKYLVAKEKTGHEGHNH